MRLIICPFTLNKMTDKINNSLAVEDSPWTLHIKHLDQKHNIAQNIPNKFPA